jgi:hypothetical protein
MAGPTEIQYHSNIAPSFGELRNRALITARGFRSLGPEIVKHYERAVALGRGLGDDKKLFRAM